MTTKDQNPDENAPHIGRPKVWAGDKLVQAEAEICERLASGETLPSICDNNADMPNPSTVREWVRENPAFAKRYALARVEQMQTWADEIITIADDDTLDVVTKVTPQGRQYEALDQQNVQRSRLRIDTRKFLMSKVAPHLYGERLTVEHGGTVAHVHELSDRERIRRFALFMVEDRQAGSLLEGQTVDVPALPASPPLPGGSAKPEPVASMPETASE